MAQAPLVKGEQSKVTGVRLTNGMDELFEKAAKDLVEEGYSEKEATKSAVVRSLIEFYKDYAKVAFRKSNPHLKKTR